MDCIQQSGSSAVMGCKVKRWCYTVDGVVFEGTSTLEENDEGEAVRIYKNADGEIVDKADYASEACVDCSKPVGVSLCNVQTLAQAIATAIAGNTSVPTPDIDYTSILDTISAHLEHIDGDQHEEVTHLEDVVDLLQRMRDEQLVTNDTLEQLNTSCEQSITYLEGIEQNTDELEAALLEVVSINSSILDSVDDLEGLIVAGNLLHVTTNNKLDEFMELFSPVDCSDFLVSDFYRLTGENPDNYMITEWKDTGKIYNRSHIGDAIDFVGTWDISPTNGLPIPEGDPEIVGELTTKVEYGGNSTKGESNVFHKLTSICVKTPTLVRFHNIKKDYATSLGSLAVNGNVVIPVEGVGQFDGKIAKLCPGINDLAMMCFDHNGGHSVIYLELSTDNGVTWHTLEDTPKWSHALRSECVKLKICKDTGLAYDLRTNDLVDLTTVEDCPCPDTRCSG